MSIVTGGSRGDVQPYVALGNGLVGAGHEVKVATYAPFEGFVRARGLEYARLSGDPTQIVRALQECGRDPVCIARRFLRELARFAEDNVGECLEACQGADAVIYTPIGFVGSFVAQKLGVPAASAVLQPLIPTREFPSVIWPEARIVSDDRLRGTYNRLTFSLTEQGFWQLFRFLVNGRVTKRLGLPHLPPLPTYFHELRRRRELALCGWSPTVLPAPRDWDPWARVTGYWFLDRSEDWCPPAHLEDFLESGPPPVCVGFGSMSVRDQQRVTETILSAFRSTGSRGLLVGGWAGLEGADLPEDVFKIEEVPHDWLFPRVRAVVHHGGAGTTGAVLRAGIPSIIVPFLVDQPFWGRRIEALGAGTAPIPRKLLSARALADGLRRIDSDASIQTRAAGLGEQIRAEDGVQRAVFLFERYVRGREATR